MLGNTLDYSFISNRSNTSKISSTTEILFNMKRSPARNVTKYKIGELYVLTPYYYSSVLNFLFLRVVINVVSLDSQYQNRPASWQNQI